MSDSTFDALADIPGYISSFSASIQDGSVIQSSKDSPEESSKIALASYQLLTDASLLGKSIPELHEDKIKRVIVTYPTQYHAFTVSNDAIYGIERTNNTSN